MYHYKAKCINVVDGDTMDFLVDLGFHLTNKIRVRLLGIDTPEIRGSEKELGNKVKEFVKEQLFNTSFTNPSVPVELVTEKTGSFGRWLAEVYFEDGSTLQQKIRNKFPELKL